MSFIKGTVEFAANAPKEKIASFAYYYDNYKSNLMHRVKYIILHSLFCLASIFNTIRETDNYFGLVKSITPIVGISAAPSIALGWILLLASLSILSIGMIYHNYSKINDML